MINGHGIFSRLYMVIVISQHKKLENCSVVTLIKEQFHGRTEVLAQLRRLSVQTGWLIILCLAHPSQLVAHFLENPLVNLYRHLR